MGHCQYGTQFAFPDKCRQLDWVLDVEKQYIVNYELVFANLLNQIRNNEINAVLSAEDTMPRKSSGTDFESAPGAALAQSLSAGSWFEGRTS